MDKRNIELARNLNTQSQVTVELETVVSESEGATTIENQQTSISVLPLSTSQSMREKLETDMNVVCDTETDAGVAEGYSVEGYHAESGAEQ